jgi:putative DNA methylase
MFWLLEQAQRLGIDRPSVLDPTSGGGSIPFESLRLGCTTLANDINPVAVMIQKATYEWPAKHGHGLVDEFNRLTKRFLELAEPRFQNIYPAESPGTQVLGYLWARTVHCPYCVGKVPLSPNWKLSPDGTGVKVVPHMGQGPVMPLASAVSKLYIVPASRALAPSRVEMPPAPIQTAAG